MLINAGFPVEAVKPNNTEVSPNIPYIQILWVVDMVETTLKGHQELLEKMG